MGREIARVLVTQPGSQILPSDLLRRPPEAVWGDSSFSIATCQLVRHVEGLITGEEPPAEDRLDRCRVSDLSANRGRDHLRRRIGLLGRQSSLLDGEVRSVTRGEDVFDTDDASVSVDWN